MSFLRKVTSLAKKRQKKNRTFEIGWPSFGERRLLNTENRLGLLSSGFRSFSKILLANPVDYEKKKKKTKEERGRLATEFCVKQENLKEGSGRRRGKKKKEL